MCDSDEYEYDETTLVVEINGIIEQDFLKKVTTAKVLGIETDQPLLQLDDYTFQGEYQDTIGTDMVFKDVTDLTDSPETQNGEAESEIQKKLELYCITNKKLCAQRVFLKKNVPGDKASKESQSVAEVPGPSASTCSQLPVDSSTSRKPETGE